ncbi:MAG: hypothetical protein KC590_15360 [Nitrospira sp.]|nr:hypothetical protein [Nitrospira sp.]
MSETKFFNLLRTIVFGTLLFGLWEGPTFGCEILFEVGEENKTPFSSISPTWLPSGFVGHPKYSEFRGKTIVFLPVDFESCYLQLNEPPIENTEWSENGKTHLRNGLNEYLEKKNLTGLKFLTQDELTVSQQQNFNEVRLLFDLLHIHSRNHLPKVPEKSLSDYSFGKNLIDLYPEADIFVIIKGRFYVNSLGRNFAAIGVNTGIVAATMTNPILGGAVVGVVDSADPGMLKAFNSLTISFVEASTGNLLWLKHEFVEDGHFDFRDKEGMRRFVEYFMREFLF